ncbi:Helix-turn-helix domain protein [Rubripirellula lacrimiformis]|uniref:Helix-turn-helix domain protein n=1 Tax=Rubripirellula lacrimiformis TaxID=1930273 RepID=A0A517NAR0_9BACT|nr:Helix-turn-helix domain protein [Rubripirellula lacrimiformis]
MTQLPKQPPSDVAMSVDDVATLLQCSPAHVRRLADSGRMPRPFRIGRLVRWEPSAVRAWISDGCPKIRKGGRR